MLEEIKSKKAWGGPMDGVRFSVGYQVAIAVFSKFGGGFRTRLTKTIHTNLVWGGTTLPKCYRDDPKCLGWYSRVTEMNGSKEWYSWHSLPPTLESKKQIDKKPGWMLNSQDIVDDIYGDNDPADDWKK